MMPTNDPVRMLKALADPTRLRIVAILDGRGDLCVCEIVGALQVPQYSVSRHLSILKSAGILTGWRQGKWMHYSLNPALPAADRIIIAAVCARAAADQVSRHDEKRLRSHLRPWRQGGTMRSEA